MHIRRKLEYPYDHCYYWLKCAQNCICVYVQDHTNNDLFIVLINDMEIENTSNSNGEETIN